MIPDRMYLTAEGEQALLNADVGGVSIRPKSFKVGDYTGAEPSTVPSDLLGTVRHVGRLHYVQVMSKKTAVFTVVVPIVSGTGNYDITEATVYLDDGVCLGRVRFANPIQKIESEAVYIEFMLHLSQSNAHVIDVTLSEFGSIPSVPDVNYLPAAVTSVTNAVAVLNLRMNPSENFSPGTAYRYGNGGAHWGFSDHDEIFQDRLETAAIDENTIALPSLASAYNLADGSNVIISVYSGAGVGETRRFIVTSNGNFVAETTGFSALSGSSVASIWIPSRYAGSGSGLPGREGVGPDWVLVAGTPDRPPFWAPIGGARSRTRGNLYHPPGKLNIQAIALTPTESKRSYLLYDEDPASTDVSESQIHLYSFRKNQNYSTICLEGAYQMRQAFEISNNVIEFAEELPSEVGINAWLYELAPHTGVYTRVVSAQYQGDGTTRRVRLPEPVESAFYVRVLYGRITVGISSYTYDANTNEIVFAEPPEVGQTYQIDCFVQEEIEGYSTRVVTSSVRVASETNIIILPFTPQDKEQVFVYMQGAGLYKSEYSVVGNKIITSTNLTVGMSVEVMIFDNIKAEGSPDTALRGMMIGATLTAKGYEFERQGMPAIRLPSPEFDIRGKGSVKVEGTYPNFVVSSTLDDVSILDKPRTISHIQKAADTSEIVLSRRIEFSTDTMITLTADFSAILGPGFKAQENNEAIQFLLAIVPAGADAPEYGSGGSGRGECGFNVPSINSSGAIAYADTSRSISATVSASNSKTNYVDIIASMRVVRCDIESFGSDLTVAINGMATPRK